MRYLFYRNPKTKNEATQYSAVLDYCEFADIKVRSKRRAKCLPNAWNDIIGSPFRCWKRQRKTQWRGG